MCFAFYAKLSSRHQCIVPKSKARFTDCPTCWHGQKSQQSQLPHCSNKCSCRTDCIRVPKRMNCGAQVRSCEWRLVSWELQPAVFFLQLQSFIVDTIVRIEYHSSSKHLLVIRGLYLAGYIVDRNLALPKNNHGSANEHISQALQT